MRPFLAPAGVRLFPKNVTGYDAPPPSPVVTGQEGVWSSGVPAAHSGQVPAGQTWLGRVARA